MKYLSVLLSVFLLTSALSAQVWKFDRFVNTPYPNANSVTSGDMEVADFNNDGLLDTILIGTYKAKPGIFFYMNNKTSMKLIADHGLPALHAGALIASADFDLDGDLDLALMGKDAPENESAMIRVYLNDAKGKFTLSADLGAQLPSEDFEDTAGSWAPNDKKVLGAVNANGWSGGLFEAKDLNGDKLPDLIFAGAKGMEGGTDPSGQMIQRDWETGGVFINQGKGQFKLLTQAKQDPDFTYAGFRKVNRCTGALADFDKDGVLDLALFGQANLGPLANAGIPETQRNGLPVAELYKGKGDGSFSAFPDSKITAIIDGAVRAADVNLDGNIDLILLGNTGFPKDPSGGRVLSIYLGKGDGSFTKDTSQTNLKPLMNGGAALGDIDLDGDMDLVATGNDNTRSLYVYENIDGVFTQKALTKLKDGIGANGLNGSSDSDACNSADIELLDLEGDGDIDVILAGTGGVDQYLVFKNKLK